MSDVEIRLRALEMANTIGGICREDSAAVLTRALRYLTFLDPTYGEPVNMTKEGPALPVAKPKAPRKTKAIRR